MLHFLHALTPGSRVSRGHKTMYRILIAIALLSFFATPAISKTLYVDGAVGDDSVSYANNSADRPWRTIGRAAWGNTNRNSLNPSQAAQAGDTVIVRAGTYSTTGTGNRWGVAYHTANSGRAGAPIVFQAEGTVVLTLSSSRGPVIGASGFDGPRRDYITWRGFTVHEANAPSTADTGPVVLAGTVGSTIEDCVLDGNGDPGFNDNHPGVRIEGSHDVLVRNCRISNFRTGANANNGAGIQIYWSGNVTMEHNEIYNSGSGIFLKAPTGGTGFFNIRYNHIHNINQSGIAIHRSPNPANMPINIYQNIVRHSGVCVSFWAFDQGSTDPRNAKVVNNTLYGCRIGIGVSANLVDNAGHVVRNNIIANSRDYAINFGGVASNLASHRIHFDHNLYSSYGTFAILHTSNRSLSSWKSTGQDAASRDANPMFVNAGGEDFRLQANSPARNIGIDILDLNRNGNTTDTITLGAYITGNEVIGPTTAPPAGSDVPAAPTALQLR